MTQPIEREIHSEAASGIRLPSDLRIVMDGVSPSGPHLRILLQVSLKNPACPWLPEVGEILDFSITRRHGNDKGAEFYLDALTYAQSQWCAGKPAQAILQLNKAWMAYLPPDDPVFEIHPSPYRALVWILEKASASDCGYLGNPVRHFQHLASRMSGPRAEIRSWRAWLCFHLAEKILNPAEYPRDGEQIAREGLWIPSFQQALTTLQTAGAAVDIPAPFRTGRPGGNPARTF